MKNNKIVSVFQTDCSQNVNVLLRGLSVLSLQKLKSNVIIDMRPNANIIWSYYGKNNVKFLDDILNIILDINLSMLKTYLNTDSDVLCVKDIKKIMANGNFSFVIKSLSEIYDNIYISFVDNSVINDFLFFSDIVFFAITKDPVSLSIYKDKVSKLSINKRKNMDFVPVIFKTDTDFNIDENGIARVSVYFNGYNDKTTGATIKIKIQKRFLLVFWNDVASWTDEATGYYYTNTHSTTVEKGYYRAQVENTIRGTGGTPDVITDELEYSY